MTICMSSKIYGVNWTIAMAKSPFLFLFWLFSFFCLDPSISKIIRGTDLKFCTQVGSDDPMCSDPNKPLTIHYKRDTKEIIHTYSCRTLSKNQPNDLHMVHTQTLANQTIEWLNPINYMS